MKQLARHRWVRVLAGVLLLGTALGGTMATAAYGQARFDRSSLDAMLAPIALYPDRLLSHVLMAATYPQEVEEAANWLRARPGLSGDAAVRTSEGWDWDPSVRSLLAFPMVLETMAGHIRWTQDLGEAFLAQREEVMDVIQFLRRRAYEAGTLRSNEALRVVDTGYSIVIEPALTQSVYIPYYDPNVTYGAWWWPARPPMYWPRWPGYHVPPGRPPYLVWGPAIRISSGFFFGNFVWPQREIRVIDVHPYYYPRRVIVEHHVVARHPAPPIEQRPPAPGVWQHDSRRRSSDETRAARRVNEPRAPAPGRSSDERREGGGDSRGHRSGDAPRAPERVAPAPVPTRPADPGMTAAQPTRAPQPTLTPAPAPAPETRDSRGRERSPRERDAGPPAPERRGGDQNARGQRSGETPEARPGAEPPSAQQDSGSERRAQRRPSGRDTRD